MIFYATKQTIERFKIMMPEEMDPIPEAASKQLIQREQRDPLLEWGFKLFYFDHRKCIQVMNFASKLTLFLFDVKIGDFENTANNIALYLLDLYRSDKIMENALKRLFSEHSLCAYAKLTDRSIISSLNRNQIDFADDGYSFYDYIENGILQTRAINHDVNFQWPVTQTINGKTEYIYPGERFKSLLLGRYSKHS
jgi:hypothetical protein